MGKYGTFEEHSHPEYEEGMTEIRVTYSVVVSMNGAKYRGQMDFYEYGDAEKAYLSEIENGVYDNVVLNEVQTHIITKKYTNKNLIL